MASAQRLTRSRTDRMLSGVCGGIGEYFGVDPTLIRIVWVVAVAFMGFGFLAYVILWVVLPEADGEAIISHNSAVNIAEERFARGEISAEELQRIRQDLGR